MLRILLVVSSLLWLTPAQAGSFGELTEDERTEFRNEVRAYLLDNPEVLMEAIAILEQRQQDSQATSDQALISAYFDEIFNDGYSYIGGNPDGDITLVEFLDYRCTYCRKAHEDVRELVKSDGNIRLVIKEFPILGEQSDISSKLAIATLHKSGPEAYAKLHEFLITFKGNLNDNNMAAVLQNIGLEPDPIIAYMNDAAVKGQIGAIHALATRLQITGTPTFVMGDNLIRGYVPLANMRELVKVVRSAKN